MNKEYISKGSLVEFLQDIFTIYILFELQNYIKNVYVKEIYSALGLYYCSIVFHEYSIVDADFKSAMNSKTKGFLKRWRNRFLKAKVSEGSKKINSIVEAMGTEFDYYLFDTILSVNKFDNQLFGINFGTWDITTLQTDEKTCANEIIAIVKATVENILNLDKMTQLNEALKSFANSVESQVNIEKYSYPSSRLFNYPEPAEVDKYLIMYYYSFLKALSNTQLFVPNLSITINDVELSVNKSLLKFRATFIEAFGDNVRKKYSSLNNLIANRVSELKIENGFRVNRKLRNNIHYTEISNITEEEWNLIEDFQNGYMDIVEKTFDEKLRIKLGKRYKLIKWIANHTDNDIRSGLIPPL